MYVLIRKAGRRLFPGKAADRAIAYERGLRRRLGVERVAYVAQERMGRRVLGGPFTGMSLGHQFEIEAASPVLKLLGIYESALHKPLEKALEHDLRVVANVGCADGYYAVGLALCLPNAVVHAYDLSHTARVMTHERAVENGVRNRIVIHKRCRRFVEQIDLVVCDIEGGEDGLLSPGELGRAIVLVETHDHIVPGMTDALQRRFASTHDIETLHDIAPTSVDAIDWMTFEDRSIALDEMRGSADQAWLAMFPRRGRWRPDRPITGGTMAQVRGLGRRDGSEFAR